MNDSLKLAEPYEEKKESPDISVHEKETVKEIQLKCAYWTCQFNVKDTKNLENHIKVKHLLVLKSDMTSLLTNVQLPITQLYKHMRPLRSCPLVSSRKFPTILTVQGTLEAYYDEGRVMMMMIMLKIITMTMMMMLIIPNYVKDAGNTEGLLR